MPPARLVLGNECCHPVKDGKRQGQQALGFGAWFTLSSEFGTPSAIAFPEAEKYNSK